MQFEKIHYRLHQRILEKTHVDENPCRFSKCDNRWDGFTGALEYPILIPHNSRSGPIQWANSKINFKSMVSRAGSPAMIRCEPRQARKGAAAAADSCAGVKLARPASLRPMYTAHLIS